MKKFIALLVMELFNFKRTFWGILIAYMDHLLLSKTLDNFRDYTYLYKYILFESFISIYSLLYFNFNELMYFTSF
jgi:hypothetical protein